MTGNPWRRGRVREYSVPESALGDISRLSSPQPNVPGVGGLCRHIGTAEVFLFVFSFFLFIFLLLLGMFVIDQSTLKVTLLIDTNTWSNGKDNTTSVASLQSFDLCSVLFVPRLRMSQLS